MVFVVFVIHTVCGGEGQRRAAIALVCVCMRVMVRVVVPVALPKVVRVMRVRVVSRHPATRHGAELRVMRVVAVHGCQVGATVHASEIRAGRSAGVTLGITGRLVVGHGVRGYSGWPSTS